MKAKVNKVTKWNQIYHVDYFDRVYGTRTPTNLEAVDHDGYLNNQVEWGRQSHNVLRDLAGYKDVNGHATNVTNDAQVKRSEMGKASGVATLGTDGKIPSSQLHSYVDDVIDGYFESFV